MFGDRLGYCKLLERGEERVGRGGGEEGGETIERVYCGCVVVDGVKPSQMK